MCIRDRDLVKIAPQAVPPVCKVLDYGKYRFEQQKKEKEAKKNQKVVEMCIRDRYNTLYIVVKIFFKYFLFYLKINKSRTTFGYTAPLQKF